MLGMRAHRDHLRRQDAGRAIQRGEGLVELGHVPADGRLALDQVDVVAGVGDLQRALDAGDAAAHHQRGGMDRNRHRFQRALVPDAFDAAGDHRLGLGSGRGLVGVHPRDLLADGYHLAQVGIQPGLCAGGAEGLLVQVRRAGRHDHAGQAQFLDVLLDQLLARGWST